MIKVNKVLNKYLDNDNSPKSKAAFSIKNLLGLIDFNAETVPENNHDMLTRLVISLKGKQLTTEETELIKEITNK